MTTDEIIKECFARKKLTPQKTPQQIVDEVVDEVNDYKGALAQRPEFFAPAAPIAVKATGTQAL